MPQITDSPCELPQPTPLNNFMFAAGFQSIDATTSAMSLINAVLINAGRPPLEVMDSPIIKEAFQMDQGLYQFAQQYQRNVSDPRTIDAYYGYMMECMDEQERIDTAEAIGRAEGHAKGYAEGRAEEQATIIRTMMKTMTIADISKATGLTHAEIEPLLGGQ